MHNWQYDHGSPNPLGATWHGAGYNFALFSQHATHVRLLLFAADDYAQPCYIYDFDSRHNRTADVWHCYVAAGVLNGAQYYAYQVDGPHAPGSNFAPEKILLDPWARGVYFPPDFSRLAAFGTHSNAGKAALGCLVKDTPAHMDLSAAPRHGHDLIIYEMHVRGFTEHHTSGVADDVSGTFAGIKDKIPYLKELGVTAVELLPVHQYDPQENNYWGYMTLNFFAPHHLYCKSTTIARQIEEFRDMVRALHAAGIEVILDVVYNHTVEEFKDGLYYSWKGIDNAAYYLLDDNHEYINDTGCGNTLRTAYSIVRRMVLDSLRYWVQVMGVDGFRFDLASILTRNDDGSINTHNPPIIEEITMDPVLSQVRLIAEPWDIASYQVGHTFPGKNWAQWNGKYRDDIRRFVKGEYGMVSALMRRLPGSDDLFPPHAPHHCSPLQSVNFITAHDGFTLYDLVAYNQKYNVANGYNNTDGTTDNYSWNCGTEGDAAITPAIMRLRKQQAKNMVTLLMLSNGIPMLTMGDEMLHTHKGNNNPYNQDNELNWLNWELLQEHADMYRFFKEIIAFRKGNASICRRAPWGHDVQWYGTGEYADIAEHSLSLAYYLAGGSHSSHDIYVMINSYWEPLHFTIQKGKAGEWVEIINTARESPADINTAAKKPVNSMLHLVAERSIVVLRRTAK
ncbi:MAG: isoamylase [Bacteroidota bacterium]